MNRDAILARAQRRRTAMNCWFAGMAVGALASTLFDTAIAAGIYVAGMIGAHGFACFWEAEVRRWS